MHGRQTYRGQNMTQTKKKSEPATMNGNEEQEAKAETPAGAEERKRPGAELELPTGKIRNVLQTFNSAHPALPFAVGALVIGQKRYERSENMQLTLTDRTQGRAYVIGPEVRTRART